MGKKLGRAANWARFSSAWSAWFHAHRLGLGRLGLAWLGSAWLGPPLDRICCAPFVKLRYQPSPYLEKYVLPEGALDQNPQDALSELIQDIDLLAEITSRTGMHHPTVIT